MTSTDVQIGVVLLLEQCAQQRAGVVVEQDEDKIGWLRRMLQAEAAGRELMAALIRLDAYPELSLGARIRRLIGYVQTVLRASTPHDQIAPLLTTRLRPVAIGAEAARLLSDAVLLLVLAAWDGGAQNVDVLLSDEREGVCLTIESDQSGAIVDLPALYPLRERISACGGTWQGQAAAHGGSWQVQVVLPLPSAGTSE